MDVSEFYRKKINFKENEIIFQALEWIDFDEKIEDEDDLTIEKYNIKIFGSTKEGYSVCLNILDFHPYFYIKIPMTWDKGNTTIFLSNLSTVNAFSNGKTYQTLYKWKRHLLNKECVIVDRKDYYEYHGNMEYKFLKLVFDNKNAMKRFKYAINAHNQEILKTESCSGKQKIKNINNIFEFYEDNLDPILRLIHIKGLSPCGWIKAESINILNYSFKKSKCQIEANVDWEDISSIEDQISLGDSRFLQASFDIEVFSVDGMFPVATIDGNVVTQISTVFKYNNDESLYLCHIICLKECAQLNKRDDNVPVILEWYNTEKEVLLAWKKLINRMDPDILYTYNGDLFDCDYLYCRADIIGIKEKFLNIGRLKDTLAVMTNKTFTSSAYGTNVYKRLVIPGRINFDLCIFISREYKENSYKLDDIAEKYLNEKKHGVSVTAIFDNWASGDPEKIKTIAEYCIQDSVLLQRLVDKLFITHSQLSMSNVTFVPFKYLIERGQQIKLFSQILRETRKKGFLVPSFFGIVKQEIGKYEGATVLDPKKGAYYLPITVADFASLYPSIMRAHNLCHSTLITDSKYLIEGEYNTFEWDSKLKNIITGEDEMVHFKYNYIKPEIFKGIVPDILSELSKSRSNAKAMMKNSTKELYDIYNRLQLAYKVSMNSAYGFMAAQMLTCKPVAATVTAIGRKMIGDTKEFIEKKYPGSNSIYGDSVTGDTPLLLRDPITKLIHIKTIKELSNESNESIDYPGFKMIGSDGSIRQDKQYSLTHFEVWSDLGWTSIRKIIKHKTNKKIFRVLTHTGCVDVTEDHSLIRENNGDIIKIKPGELQIGELLLHSFPNEFPGKETCNNIIYDSSNLIEKAINNMELEYNNDSQNVILYSSLFSDKKNSQILYYILRSSGKNVSFKDDHLKGKNSIINTNAIISITELESSTIEEYVYDLETDCGRFQAGVGQLIVSNTDSIFLEFNTELTMKYSSECEKYNTDNISEKDQKYLDSLKTECIKESMILGKEAADAATKELFIYPISLEYEKVYCPLLMLSKKRYIGKLYENDASKEKKQDSKGVTIKRRDGFKLLRDLYQQILDVLMENNSTKERVREKVTKIVNTVIKHLINGDIDIDDLTITKAYKGNYKNENIPHVALAAKIKERDPGNAVKPSDRVSYVFIDTLSNRNEPQYKKVEDPKYATEHSLKLDLEYYINAFKTPISEIIGLILENPEKLFDEPLNKYKKERVDKLRKLATKTNIVKKHEFINFFKTKKISSIESTSNITTDYNTVEIPKKKSLIVKRIQ